MTEAQLIERAGSGDARAIRILYDRHAARVFAVARRIVGDEERARDCAQEAWVRAIRALPDFRGEARFATWLHRIAVNSALQAARSAERRAKVEVSLPESLSGTEPSPDALLRRRLEQALALLPSGMRQVLVLHDVEGHTHDEVADLLGVTPGTSKSQLFKARARMRELLSEGVLLRHHAGARI